VPWLDSIEVSAMGQAGNTNILDRPVLRDAVKKVRNILIEVNAIGRGDNTIDPLTLCCGDVDYLSEGVNLLPAKAW